MSSGSGNGRPAEAAPVDEPPLRSGGGDPPGDMAPAELRRRGHEAYDWIERFFEELDSLPVLARVRPGEIRNALPSDPPEEGESFDRILRDFRDVIVPGMTQWNHPAFFGYYPSTGSAPGVLGETLAAALNGNAMVWRSSPAGTELEEVALGWLRQLLGLPDGFTGVINDTASSSSLYALAAAREAALPDAREEGLAGGPRARIYASTQAHSSIDKAALTLGLGRRGVRKIEADEAFRMRPEVLRRALEEDREEGIVPVAVVATVGTTSTSSVDPVAAAADVAEEHGLWLHVDAAYGGAAAALPELRSLFDGWERADSVVVNPHKWLFTPVDCSALYCRRPEMLRGAFSLTPEYLRTREEGEARNLMDYGVSLGRRFRALKLWFVLRYFGAEGIRRRIRGHVRLARRLAAAVDEADEWERVAPTPFSSVAFRYAPPGAPDESADRWNREIMERANDTGDAFLSHTELRGRTCLRLAIGNLHTRWKHVEETWELLRRTAREVAGEPCGSS